MCGTPDIIYGNRRSGSSQGSGNGTEVMTGPQRNRDEVDDRLAQKAFELIEVLSIPRAMLEA